MISRRLVAPGLAALLAVATLSFLPSSARAEAKVESDLDKAIYLIGVDFSRRLQQLFLTEKEIEIVARGLREGYAGEALDLDPTVYGPKLALMQEERAKNALAIEAPKAAAYIEAEKGKPGAQVSDTGVIFTEVVAGDGANPAMGSKVKVHYTGTLRNGTVFDSSVQRGTPAEFVLGQVIACWNEAIPKMKVGGKARLVCPSDVAYGDTGVPGVIPPGAVLTFDVELLGVVQ